MISAVTLAELEYGVACSGDSQARNAQALADFLTEVPAVPFDGAAASLYGPLRAATRDRKRDKLDKLIGAHALALDAVLVTNKLADFSDFPGLKLENWVAAH